jgi:tetratricopeptide (TPR) repeat protein
MAAWAPLSSFVKRHTVWFGAIITVVGIGTYVTTLLTPAGTFLSEKAAQIACEYQQKPIANESEFTILVSPLRGDPDGSHTEKVKSAFHGEKGFRVVPICESVGFDYSSSKDVQTVDAETVTVARDLIKKNHADLLLFGEVSEQDKAIKIWAVNESGGCDLQPKPTIIEHGNLSGEFTAEQKDTLIRVSLKEIQSACLNQSSIIWPDFAKRMNKMEMFLKYFDFTQAKGLYFASSYIEAMRLLYSNGQGDAWFSKGEMFAKRVINKAEAKDEKNSQALSSIYVAYAILLGVRFDNTKDRGDRDAELAAIDKAIGLDPKNAFAYANRGAAYANKNELDRAIDDYSKAIDLNPIVAFAYLNRGVAFEEKRDLDRAIEDYTKGISLDSKNAQAYYTRGNAYLKMRDLDRAIDDYSKAISLDPKLAQVYYTRGYAYSDRGDFDRAIADFSEAVNLRSKFAPAYLSRGYVYFNKGDLDRAIDDYSKAISLDPKLAQAYYTRGYAYSDDGNFDRAIDDYTKAIFLDPKYALAYVDRGLAYEKRGEWDHAIADYTRAIDLDPKYALPYVDRGLAYEKRGEWDHAIADYTRAIDLDPRLALAYSSRGLAYANKSEWDHAIEDFTKAIGLNPVNSDAYRGRGEAYKAKGDMSRAKADFLRSVELKRQ